MTKQTGRLAIIIIAVVILLAGKLGLAFDLMASNKKEKKVNIMFYVSGGEENAPVSDRESGGGGKEGDPCGSRTH